VVQYNFFDGLYPQFCRSVDGDKTRALSQVLTNKDFKNPTEKRLLGAGSLRARTPPASSNQYPEYKFDFDWSGGDGICREDCIGAFKAIAASPCKCPITGSFTSMADLPQVATKVQSRMSWQLKESWT
jgi:hypothetical protein